MLVAAPALLLIFVAQLCVVGAITIPEKRSDKVVKVAVDGTQTVDTQAKLGSPQLFMAVRQGNGPAVTMLLERYGSEVVNAAEPDGTTPLLLAAQIGDLAMVQLLLGKGALHVARPDGATPLRMASLVALQDKPITMGLINILYGAIAEQTEPLVARRFQTSAEALDTVISLLTVEAHERGQPPPPSILAVATELTKHVPAEEVRQTLAAVLCATGSMLKGLLFTRCQIDEAATMLSSLPCIADGAADPSPLPSKMEAMANLIEARRYQGDEAGVAALATTMMKLSEETARQVLVDGDVNATGLHPLKLHSTLTNRARAMGAVHDYEGAFALYRNFSTALPRKLASGRILFPSSTSESLVMTSFQLEE